MASGLARDVVLSAFIHRWNVTADASDRVLRFTDREDLLFAASAWIFGPTGPITDDSPPVAIVSSGQSARVPDRVVAWRTFRFCRSSPAELSFGVADEDDRRRGGDDSGGGSVELESGATATPLRGGVLHPVQHFGGLLVRASASGGAGVSGSIIGPLGFSSTLSVAPSGDDPLTLHGDLGRDGGGSRVRGSDML
jgi:hypothetical protein